MELASKVPCKRCDEMIVYPPANVCTLCLIKDPKLREGER